MDIGGAIASIAHPAHPATAAPPAPPAPPAPLAPLGPLTSEALEAIERAHGWWTRAVREESASYQVYTPDQIPPARARRPSSTCTPTLSSTGALKLGLTLLGLLLTFVAALGIVAASDDDRSLESVIATPAIRSIRSTKPTRSPPRVLAAGRITR